MADNPNPIPVTSAVVAVERVSEYGLPALGDAIRRTVDPFGGWARLVRAGDKVLVKPNCISSVPPEKPAQTHPAMILEVCRQLLDHGARPFVGDSPAWGSLMSALNSLGIVGELARLGVPIVPFKRPIKVPNPRGKVFATLTVDAAALDADAIVNLPKFKTHRQILLTLALKNMFGCVGGRRKAWWHFKAGGYENYFGRMLVETFDMLRPTITILDAVVAMEGLGPIRGSPFPLGLIMASTDGPALERVAADVVGVKPDDLRTLQAARELGVGTPFLDRIRIAGPSLSEIRRLDFKFPSLLPIGFSIPRLVKGALTNAWLTHQQARRMEQTN